MASTTTLQRRLCMAAGLLGLAAVGVRAEAVRDHITNPDNWRDPSTSEGYGMLDNFRDSDSYWASVTAAPIVGDGRELKRVGILWARASIMGEPDGGDPLELRWRFRFFPETAGFSLAALYLPPADPRYEAIFEAPANTDWLTPVGQFFGFSLCYAEVRVGRLHVATTPGATHLVTLVPESRLAMPGTITAIAVSLGTNAVGSGSDWYERGAYDPEGPGPLESVDPNFDFLAYRVTVGWAADFDEDDDVDLVDFAQLADCMEGPGVSVDASSPCADTDLDGDTDVDLADFALFQAQFGQPG